MLETRIPGSLLLPFRLTLPFHWLHRSYRFNSSRPFDTSFFWFQRVHPVLVLLPFVLSRSCGYVLSFVSIPIHSCRLHVCFIATRLFRLLLPSFRFNSFLPFAVVHFLTSVLTFPSFIHAIRYFFPFVSPLTVRLLLELFRCISLLSSVVLPSFRLNSSLPFGRSFRFNSFLSFVTVFLSFQLSPFIRYFLPFVSTLTSRSLLLPFVSSRSFRYVRSYVSPRLYTPFVASSPSFHRFTSYSPFVTWTLSLQLYPFIRYTSILSFKLFPSVRPLLSYQLFPFISFFQILWDGATQTKQLLAATCGHLRPLAATCSCGHLLLRPLAASCGHLRPLAATCGLLRPLAATCGHLRPLAATCGHLRPLAASGATCGHFRPLAATCGHLQPLATTWGHSSGCK